jgi:hypothetical protein
MSGDFVYRPKPKLNVETKASSYDLLNGILVACIILFGFLFTILLMIWLTTVFDFSRRAAGPIPIANEPGDSKPEGVADDILEPGVEEFPEVETPQLASALEAVTDAVSSVKASLSKRSGDAAQMGRGGGFGSREGGPGTGGDGVPEYKRWIINYEAGDIGTYRKMLAFFNIDVGIVHKVKNDIWRVRVADGQSIKSDKATEKGLYFTHKKLKMQRWDQEIARQAGVDISNTIPCQFYPEETRQKIRIAEAEALKGTGRNLVDVRNTMFKVEPEGSGYKYQVIDILYR